MSSQKGLVVLTAFLSFIVLLVCCCAPAALFVFNYGFAQERVQALLVSASLATPLPTKPRATATLSGPIPTPTKPLPTATLEAGWKLYPMARDGFAIAYPSTWAYQDVDPATIKSVIASLKKNNPQLANLMESQQGQVATAGVKYFAIDSGPNATAGGLLTNSNLIHQTLDQTYNLDFVIAANMGQLEKMSMVSKPVSHRRVQFPAGEAEELRYILNIVNENKQTVKISTTQYLFINGKESYTLTFSTAPSLESKNLAIFEKIARTFRYIGY